MNSFAKLKSDVKWVTVNAMGNGFALVELAYRYHVNAPDVQPAFFLKTHGKLVDDQMSLEITFKYNASQ